MTSRHSILRHGHSHGSRVVQLATRTDAIVGYEKWMLKLQYYWQTGLRTYLNDAFQSSSTGILPVSEFGSGRSPSGYKLSHSPQKSGYLSRLSLMLNREVKLLRLLRSRRI